LRPIRRARPASDYAAVVLSGVDDTGRWDSSALEYLVEWVQRGAAPVWLINVGLPETDTLPDVARGAAGSLRTEPAVFTAKPWTTDGGYPVLDDVEAARARRWADGIAGAIADGIADDLRRQAAAEPPRRWAYPGRREHRRAAAPPLSA
jgi:hypothetical protein